MIGHLINLVKETYNIKFNNIINFDDIFYSIIDQYELIIQGFRFRHYNRCDENSNYECVIVGKWFIRDGFIINHMIVTIDLYNGLKFKNTRLIAS